MKRTMLRVKGTGKGKRWCELEVELTDEGRFTMSGAEGTIVSPARARKMALEYWTGYFDDSPEAIIDMNKRTGKRLTTARGAAKYVVECDGEYHGLDVHHEDDGEVYLTESCGQIRETIDAFFPEASAFWKWHLNDMHAECEHQEARGETWETHPRARCGDCGYVLGSAWTKRALPSEVVAWARGEAADKAA